MGSGGNAPGQCFGAYPPMPNTSEITAGCSAAGMRLDVFLAERHDRFPSKKAAYKAIKRGEVAVNGTTVRDPQLPLTKGDILAVSADSRPPPPPLAINVAVVYEDDHLAVVEKPPGLPVSGNFSRTLLRALPHNLEPSAAADILRSPQPVHRLDGPTGGLVLIAKSASALADIGRQFENREVL